MAKAVRPIPEHLHSVTPHLAVDGAAEAIEFYKRAFGAQELVRMPMPDGKSIAHAEIRVGDSTVWLADAMPGMGAQSPKTLGNTTVTLNIYVEDADALWDRAVKAGAKVAMPLADMFWGDRYGPLTDPFGHMWAIATHKEDVAPEEMARRAKEAFAQMAAQPQGRSA